MHKRTVEPDLMHPNLVSYEGVESLSTFDDARFQDYCESKLRASAKRVNFIRKHLGQIASHRGRFCEIGSGNGNLLLNLELSGVLRQGVGYELSESRHRFAEKFKRHFGSSAVINKLGNFLDASPERDMDVCIGVDVVMSLIGPLSETAEADAVKWLHESLRPGGALVLDFRDWNYRVGEAMRHGGELRTWQEFPEPDPWQFMLETTNVVNERDMLWTKLFLSRSGTERSTLKMVLRSHTQEQAEALLTEAGFVDLQCHNTWHEDVPPEVGLFILVGFKPN